MLLLAERQVLVSSSDMHSTAVWVRMRRYFCAALCPSQRARALAVALPALMSWYAIRVRQLARRVMALLKKLKARGAAWLRRRIWRFLTGRDNGGDEPPLDLAA
ncbi:hypothetical protein [Streptomyces sp. NPDC001978]|uniref:hypothetical protein n=1 Tax=Streptomyces sp. NPDC001978 TaxID=3364627 RepID=UPI003677BA17